MKKISLLLLLVTGMLAFGASGCRRCDPNVETCPVYSGSGDYDGWDSGWDSGWDDDWGGGGDWDSGGGGGGWDDDDDGDWGGGGGGGGDDDGTYCDGTGFCYREGNPTSGRDTVANVGEEEMARVQSTGKKFAAKFSLSEEVGINVAKAFYDYKIITKTRTRTEADVNRLTERLYGMQMSRITNSIKEMEKGNLAPVQEAIEDAADHWGTTPETMQEVLKDWYKDYLPKN